MSDFEKQLGNATDYVVGKIDHMVDAASDVLSSPSGKKVVGAAAVGALATVVLPVSVGVGAILGAGYAVFRQIGKTHPHDHESGEPHPHPSHEGGLRPHPDVDSEGGPGTRAFDS